MFAVLTGAGLSVSAGLNAYIPLLLVGLISKFTDQISFPPSWDWLSTWWALTAMTVLLIVEFVVDKIAVVDHVNDIIQTLIRPASGGAVLSAATAAGDLDEATGTAVASIDNPTVAWILGIALALGVHITKVVIRPMINAGTLGFGTPVVSAAEDTGSFGMSLLSIFVPILAGIALIFILIAIILLWRARRKWKKRRADRKVAKIAEKYSGRS